MRLLNKVFIICVLSLICSCGVSITTPEVRTIAPDFIFTDLDGEQFLVDNLFESNSSPAVEQVLVVFWSMHCSNSRNFIGRLRDQEIEIDPGTKILLINLNNYDALDDLKVFIHENKLDKMQHAFSGNREEDEAYLAFKSPAFPVGYLINKNREILKIYQ